MYDFTFSAFNVILLLVVVAGLAYLGRKVYRKFYPKK
jgi:hypothetical protein